MKKSLAFLLIISMLIPIFASCNNTAGTPDAPDTESHVVLTTDTIVLHVSPDGDDSTADGTAEKPFCTIEAAARTASLLDANEYLAVDILIGEGDYNLTSTIVVEKIEGYVPIRFVGKGNVTVSGNAPDGLFTIYGDGVTLENLKLTGSPGNAISVSADNFTLQNCEITGISGEYALKAVGNSITVSGNHIRNCSGAAVLVDSGNLQTLEKSNSIISNNYIHDYGTADDTSAAAIIVRGVGITVAHNEISNSTLGAIDLGGAYITVEYNKITDVLKNGSEKGAITLSGIVQVDTAVRYNHIKNVGDISKSIEGNEKSSAILTKSYASYYEVYGNVIETVAGNGIKFDSRGAIVRNNLLIDCSNWYVWCITHNYAKFFKYGETDGRIEVPDYIYSPVWKEANPDLASVITDLSQTTHTDPLGWAAPVGNVIMNNWVHFNRGIRDFSNWGMAPYSIEDNVFTYSADNIDVSYGSHDNQNISEYNSRRGTLDLEKLITDTAAGFVDMDMERFSKIGRVMDKWNLN